jgi:hypothetical protein
MPYHINSLTPPEPYPPLLYPTCEVPTIIHLNNNPKSQLEEWWGKLWWKNLHGNERFRDIVSRVEGAVLRFAGSDPKVWREVGLKSVLGI